MPPKVDTNLNLSEKKRGFNFKRDLDSSPLSKRPKPKSRTITRKQSEDIHSSGTKSAFAIHEGPPLSNFASQSQGGETPVVGSAKELRRNRERIILMEDNDVL